MYSFSLSLRDLFSSPLERMREALRAANGEVDNLQGNMDNMSNRGGGALDSLVGKAKGLLAVYASMEGVKALFNIGVEAEQTNVKFQVLLGSAERGQALLGQLNEYANFTPYSNGGITKAAETMLGFGIVQDKIMPNMQMLGDVAMGNEEKLGSLSLVYSQIMATGKLMGQDLLQLINQGFNPLQIISDNTGISMGTLKEKMEKGAISSEMVAEAFRIATSEGGRYYQMADKMSETAGGKWSTFLGQLQEKVKQLGLWFSNLMLPVIDFGINALGYLDPFVAWLKDVFTWITSNKPLLIFLSGIFLALGLNFVITNAAVVAMSITMGILNGVIWLVTAATTAWNFVLSMNPISLVIIAIAALVAAVVYLWQKFDWFRGGVMGVWEVLKGLGDMIKNYVIGRINDLMRAISGVGNALEALRNGDFSKAMELGKGVVADLTGKDTKAAFLTAGAGLGKSFNQGYAAGVGMGAPGAVKAVGKAVKKADPTAAAPGVMSDEFNSLLGNTPDKDKKGKKKKGKKVGERADGIAGGGSRLTNITVNIAKLQDQTVIQVDSTEKGLSGLGDKVQEILLRAVNSVNQMQTS